MIIVIESDTDTDTPLNPFLDIYGSIYWLSIYRVIILVIVIQKNRHKKGVCHKLFYATTTDPCRDQVFI